MNIILIQTTLLISKRAICLQLPGPNHKLTQLHGKVNRPTYVGQFRTKGVSIIRAICYSQVLCRSTI